MTKKQLALNALLMGLVASLDMLIVLVILSGDYQVMLFLRFYSLWIATAIVAISVVARLFSTGIRTRFSHALLGVFMIWAAAYALAPL